MVDLVSMMAVGTANESCCDSQILFGVRQILNLDVVKQLLHQFVIIIIFHLLSAFISGLLRWTYFPVCRYNSF